MLKVSNSRQKKYETKLKNLHRQLAERNDSVHNTDCEALIFEYIYVIRANYDDKFVIQETLKNDVVQALYSFILSCIDKQFFTSISVIDGRGRARKEIVEDLEKMQQSFNVKQRANERRRRIHQRWECRRRLQHVEESEYGSSSDEKHSFPELIKEYNPEQNNGFFNLLASVSEHSQVYFSSEEEEHDKEHENELIRAKTEMLRYTRRDKVVLAVRLLFDLIRFIPAEKFRNLMEKFYEEISDIHAKESNSDQANLACSNFIIIIEEIGLMIMKEVRWRNNYCEDILILLQKTWDCHANTLTFMCTLELSEQEIINHIVTIWNIKEAMLLEYFFAIGTKSYTPSVNYADLFFNIENSVNIDFSVIAEELTFSLLKFQKIIQTPSPEFYRQIIKFLLAHYQRVNKTTLTKFLMSCPAGLSKTISICELCYITSKIESYSWIGIFYRHTSNTDYLTYILDGEEHMTENFVVLTANDLISRLAQFDFEIEQQLRKWLKIVKNLVGCHIKLLQEETKSCAVFTFDMSDKCLFELVVEMLKNLIQRSEFEKTYHKPLIGVIRQITRIIPYYDSFRSQIIIDILSESKMDRFVPDYTSDVAKFVIEAFNVAEKFQSKSMKRKTFSIVDSLIKSAICRLEIVKSGDIKVILKVIYDHTIVEIENSHSEVELAQRVTAAYFDFFHEAMDLIESLRQFRICNETEFEGIIASCKPFLLLSEHLVKAILTKQVLLQLGLVANHFQSELNLFVDSLLSKNADVYVVTALMTVLEGITTVENSFISDELKNRVCAAFVKAVYNVCKFIGFEHNIFKCQQSYPFKKMLFKKSKQFLAKSFLLEYNIIDTLAETNDSLEWLLTDLVELCEPGQVVPLLIHKFDAAKTNSLAQEKLLEVLYLCSTSIDAPPYYHSNLELGRLFEKQIDLTTGFTVALWIKLPDRKLVNVFTYINGKTLQLTFPCDRKTIGISFMNDQKLLTSDDILIALANPNKWNLITIGLKLVDGRLHAQVSFNYQIVRFNSTDISLISKNVTPVQWNFSGIYHSSITTIKDLLDLENIAELISIGVFKTYGCLSTKYSEIMNISLIALLKQMENADDIINRENLFSLFNGQKEVSIKLEEVSSEKDQLANCLQQFVSTGGVPALLVVFGKKLTVQVNCKIQNIFMRIIFQLLRKPHIGAGEVDISAIKSNIALLLKSENFLFDEEMFKTLIIHCFEMPRNQKLIDNIEDEDIHFYEFDWFKNITIDEIIEKSSFSVIRDAKMLQHIIMNRDLWLGKPDFFLKLIEIIVNCVIGKHYQFNINEAKLFVKTLLNTLSIISEINSDSWKVDGDQLAKLLRQLLVSIISSLNGEEKLEAVTDIWDCVLLMKTASHMYVEHQQNLLDWFSADAIERELESISTIKIDFTSEHRSYGVLSSFNHSSEDSDVEIQHSMNRIKDLHEDEPSTSHENKGNSNSDSPVSFSTFQISTSRSWQLLCLTVLYDILIEHIKLCPDSQKLSMDQLSTEILIVMLTEEHDTVIVTRIVKLIQVLMNHSATFEDKYVTAKSHQFKFLAAQLRGKHTDISVSNSLFSILFHEEVDITAGLDSGHVKEFKPDLISCQILEPIFIVLQNSLNIQDDGKTFVYNCSALCSIFENNIQLAHAMADKRIEEVLIRIIIEICEDEEMRISQNGHGAKKSAIMMLAKKIVYNSGTTSIAKIFNTSERLLKFLIIAYVEQTIDSRSWKLTSSIESLYRCLSSLLFVALQSLLDSADSDNQQHRSASNANTPFDTANNTPEELEYVFVQDISKSFTDEIVKFRDKMKEKLMGLTPNLKCPYDIVTKYITTQEMTMRVRRLFGVIQSFYTICSPMEYGIDEEECLYQSYFTTLMRVSFDETLLSQSPWFLTIQNEGRSELAMLVANILFDYPRKVNGVMQSSKHNTRRSKMINTLLACNPNKVKTVLSMNINIKCCIEAAALEEISLPDNDVMAKQCLQFLQFLEFSYYEHALNIDKLDDDTKQALESEYDIVAQWCHEKRKEGIRNVLCAVYGWIGYQGMSEELKAIANDMTQHAVTTQGVARKHQFVLINRQLNEEVTAWNEFSKYEKNFGHLGRCFKKRGFQPIEVSAVQGPRGERIRFDDSIRPLPSRFHKVDVNQSNWLEELWESIPMTNPNQCVSEKTLYSFEAILVLNGSYYDGVLVFTNVHINFFSNLKKGPNIELSFSDILVIHNRRFEFKNLAVEMFMNNQSTWFFAWKKQDEFEFAMSVVTNRSQCDIAKPTDLYKHVKDWESGKITNFEYIMILNSFAGRTYHDFMQYPIMPHVISNFDEPYIDLRCPENYRNFGRPIAIQNEKMEARYRNCYEMLQESAMSDVHSAPYHYASLYSNLATVSYYLVRSLQHAKIAIEFQDGNFDCPDRIFHDVSASFRLAAGGSATDYKELVPEMFTTSEVFLNKNKMDFGKCQNGVEVEDVVLPEWCDGNQYNNPFFEDDDNIKNFKADLFIIAQRHALESIHTQKHLNEWIDLVFGYKQTGEAAKQAMNVYHPACYPENTPSSLSDPIQLAAYAANVRNIGQVPIQLFNKPHVQRNVETNDVDFWKCGRIHGLSVGSQIFKNECKIKKSENNDDFLFTKLKTLVKRETDRKDGQTRLSNNVGQSSTFFPVSEDFHSIDVSYHNDLLLVTDTESKACVEKRMRKKISFLRFDSDFPIVACMFDKGVIEIYRIIRIQETDEKTIDISFHGTICSTFGSFRDFDLCQSFNALFSISESIGNRQFISVWDLHEKRFIRGSQISGSCLNIVGILRHTGEMIAADFYSYATEFPMSKMCKFSINGRLMMKQKFGFGFTTGTVSQMKPGEGIPMAALICTDFLIRIIETITLTSVYAINITQHINSFPTKIKYDDDWNLIVVDNKNKKWSIIRKQ